MINKHFRVDPEHVVYDIPEILPSWPEHGLQWYRNDEEVVVVVAAAGF